jgi:hypothetical protein
LEIGLLFPSQVYLRGRNIFFHQEPFSCTVNFWLCWRMYGWHPPWFSCNFSLLSVYVIRLLSVHLYRYGFPRKLLVSPCNTDIINSCFYSLRSFFLLYLVLSKKPPILLLWWNFPCAAFADRRQFVHSVLYFEGKFGGLLAQVQFSFGLQR